MITVLSTDQENNPDVLGTIAASAALTISEIPFLGPIAAVRVGRIDGEFVINPTMSQLADSELDLIVSGTRDAIMMVEAGVKLLTEDVMAEAILFGHRSLQPLIDLQEELQKAVGKAKQIPYIEPGTESVLDFVAKVNANDEFVVVDTETTGTDPKMADLVEIAAVRIKGGKIADKWSTLRQPGPVDRRPPDARHHRQGRQGRAVAQGSGRDVPLVRRQGDPRRPLGRLRPRRSSRRPRATASASPRTATSTRSCSPARVTRASARATS